MADTGTIITASEMRVGDTVQHVRKMWPPAEIVTITPSPYMPGVSRYQLAYPSGRTATLSSVPAAERFIRY